MSIQNVASWNSLQKDWNRLKDVHLNDLFLENPKRFDQFSFSKDDLNIDFSKECIDEGVLRNLIKLAKECNLEQQRDAMFSGKYINSTENRAVMHVALRANSTDAYEVDAIQTSDMVDDVLNEFLNFADSIRSGEITNSDGNHLLM
jgi:glucose-6-phosphate isomerase